MLLLLAEKMRSRSPATVSHADPMGGLVMEVLGKTLNTWEVYSVVSRLPRCATAWPVHAACLGRQQLQPQYLSPALHMGAPSPSSHLPSVPNAILRASKSMIPCAFCIMHAQRHQWRACVAGSSIYKHA